MTSRNNRPGNVCLVTTHIPPTFSGAGHRAYRFAQRLHQQGMLGLMLAHKHPANSPKYPVADPIPAQKVFLFPANPIDTGSTLRRTLYLLPYTIMALVFLLPFLIRRRHSFDIMHCFGVTWFALYALGIAKILGKKTILEVTLLGSDDPLSIRRHGWGIAGRIQYWLFSKTDITISISPALSAAYLASGLPKNRLHLVANPVDVETYAPPSAEEKRALRTHLGLPTDASIILQVGAVIKRKGADLLIDAFLEVAKHHRNAILVMAGPYRGVSDTVRMAPIMQQMANEAGVGDRLFFTGQVHNVHEYMKASDVFVLASRKEGLPNVILEAMATGLPVVSSRIANITEYIIEDGQDGLIVEAERADTLAEAIDRLLRDTSFATTLGQRARETAVARFSREIIDKQYKDIYSDLTQAP